MLKYKIFFATMALLLLTMVGCSYKENNNAAMLEQCVQTFNKGELVKSYQQLQQIIDVMEEQGDTSNLLEAKTFLGILYHTMGQNQTAFNLFKSLPQNDTKGRRNRVFLISVGYIAYYTATIEKDYKKALEYCKRTIELSLKEKGNDDLLYMNKLNMAEILIMSGDTTTAWKIVEDVTSKSSAFNKNWFIQLRLVQTLLMMKRNDYDKAYFYAKNLVGKDKSYWNINNNIAALEIITKIDSIRGDMSEYIANRNMLDSLKNNVQSNEIKYKLALMKEQYQLKNMKIENSKRRILYNCSIGLLLVIAASLAVVLIIQYRQRKIRERMNDMERSKFDEDIQRKRLENELLQLKLQKKGEELNKVYKDNVSMSVLLAETPTGSKDYGTQLEYLETVLKRQYGDFLKKLNHQYPHLSYNESLIMGLTKMGITPKDMATALGISQESLNKARYRLRKKIGLKNTEELDNLITTM